MMATLGKKGGKKRKRATGKEKEDDGEDFTPPRCAAESPGPHHFRGAKSQASRGSDDAEALDSDEWQTCKESWLEITPILSRYKKKRVWMPFYYDGKCSQHLRECGFRHVWHKKRDFFHSHLCHP